MADAILPASRTSPHADAGESPAARALRRLFRRKGAVVGLIVLALFIAIAVFAPWIAPYDPNATNGVANIIYSGAMAISPAPISTSYSNDMRMVTVSLNWKTGSLNRSRSYTTYIARNGLQNYIY